MQNVLGRQRQCLAQSGLLSRCGRRGSTLVEFGLGTSFFLLPLLFGLPSVGMSLVRSIQTVEFSRDAAHLYSKGVDFSQAANQNMLLTVTGNLNITLAGGTGVVILTGIEETAPGEVYCIQRFVIGNAALRRSSFCSPSQIDSGGNVNYTQDPGANARVSRCNAKHGAGPNRLCRGNLCPNQ